jgi:hypothetical protein
MVVPPLSGTEDSVAIVHIQSLNPQPIIEQLRKLGYSAGSPSLEEEAPAAPAERRRYWADAL